MNNAHMFNKLKTAATEVTATTQVTATREVTAATQVTAIGRARPETPTQQRQRLEHRQTDREHSPNQ